MSAPLILEAGPLRAVPAPARGGSVAALRLDGVDPLRPGPTGGRGPPTDLGCFPMAPLCNPVRDNMLRIGARV